MEVLLVFIIFAVSLYGARRNRHKYRFGVLATKRGQKFAYTLGNYLQGGISDFHGIDIQLPRPMVNLYLDSHKDSRRRGPDRYFAASQKIQLEGNFNRYFQLFAPKNTEVEALSIISPNVMETLMQSAARYDVEMVGDHLRLISLDKIYGDGRKEADIETAAAAVLEVIAHRLRSWQEVSPTPLRYKKGATWKLAGAYMRRSRLLMALLIPLAVAYLSGLALAVYFTLQNPHFTDLFSQGTVDGILMSFWFWTTIVAMPAAILAPLLWLGLHRNDPDIVPDFLRHT